jgi:PIN domain nuclease of toxin-antitoxin system
MRLLLDTHALLYAILEPERLSAKMRRLLEDPAVPRWVSAASLWEIAIKCQIGKLQIPVEKGYFDRHLRFLNAATLPVQAHHALAVFHLPPHHKDPFDRMLIAQAAEENLTIVTRDAAFARYDVAVLW